MAGSYAYTPRIWPSLLTVLLLVALGFFSWPRHAVPGARPFAAACLFALIWVAGATVESEEPAGIQIKFRDSGCGIPAAALERMYEPSYNTKRNSLGLGLFISHSIVQEHEGHMEVHSHEGDGTTFGI